MVRTLLFHSNNSGSNPDEDTVMSIKVIQIRKLVLKFSALNEAVSLKEVLVQLESFDKIKKEFDGLKDHYVITKDNFVFENLYSYES